MWASFPNALRNAVFRPDECLLKMSENKVFTSIEVEVITDGKASNIAPSHNIVTVKK
jgi:hypothetical protein